ncbi:MAG: hypothetical protein AAGF12_03935 [Myxococcota bacterium]
MRIRDTCWLALLAGAVAGCSAAHGRGDGDTEEVDGQVPDARIPDGSTPDRLVPDGSPDGNALVSTCRSSADCPSDLICSLFQPIYRCGGPAPFLACYPGDDPRGELIDGELDRRCEEGALCDPDDCGGSACVPDCRGEDGAWCGRGRTCDDTTGLCRTVTCDRDRIACPDHFRCAAPGVATDLPSRCQRIPCSADRDCAGGVCAEGRCFAAAGLCAELTPPPP